MLYDPDGNPGLPDPPRVCPARPCRPGGWWAAAGGCLITSQCDNGPPFYWSIPLTYVEGLGCSIALQRALAPAPVRAGVWALL